MKHLAEAGTTITASPEQAKRLHLSDVELQSLVTVSETEKSSIAEEEVDLAAILATPRAKAVTMDDEDAEDSESDVIDEADAHLLGKFVNLCDLLPPLPKKGTFDVETIKGSQYFFS